MAIGKGHPAFLLRDTATYQGNTYGNIGLYTFANGAFHKLLYADYEDNQEAFSGSETDARPIFHIDAGFEPLPSMKDFYDIRMTSSVTTFSTKGVHYDKSGNPMFKVLKVTRETTTYVFNGHEYAKRDPSS